MIFCLSESLMILSLPATVYTVLIFYFLAAGRHTARRAAAPMPAVADG